MDSKNKQDETVIKSCNPSSPGKINIKNICQKFENLSNEDTKQESQKHPIPPVRKNKTTNPDFTRSNSSSLTEKLAKSEENYFSKRRLSVRERTKFFEANMDIIKGDRRDSESTLESQVTISANDKPIHLSTPPIKPPRVFSSAEKNGDATSKFKTDSQKMTDEPDFTTQELSEKKKSHTSKNHSNTKKKIQKQLYSDKNVSKVCRRLPVQLHGNKNLLKENSQKDHKSSKVFVDLTPTTVSPPKDYGTLKRCHSEEHIYAEPTPREDRNGANQKTVSGESQNGESLHCMCSDIVTPKVPGRKLQKRPNSKDSVRNMIYSSFASLHLTQKEEQNKKEPASDGEVSVKAIQDRIIYVKSIRQISGSNICLAPKLYEALYIINILDSQPDISYSFPFKVPDAYKFPLLPHICFPDPQYFKETSSYHSEIFHFTLMEKEEKILGYCLRISGWSKTSHPLCVKLPVAICILSQFYAPLFYEKLLSEIEKHLTLPREKCFKYIRSLQKLGVPNAGAKVSIPDHTECSDEDRVIITRPLDSYKVGMELTRTLKLLDVHVLVKTVASLLLEKRVLFLSSSPSDLYHSCKAVSSLLYPFEWPHMYLPVLPTCLTVHCCSEMPYILGVLNNNKESLLELLSEQELLIIDLDKGAVLKTYNDEDTILPKKIHKAVITALNLAKNMTDPTELLRDVMISEAFIHMFVEMIGHYEDQFADEDGEVTFQKDGLLKNAYSYNIYTFLQWFSETQMFNAFISKCAWRIKYTKLSQDLTRTNFEKRIDHYKWEVSQDREKFSRLIEKTVRNIGGRIIHKLMK